MIREERLTKITEYVRDRQYASIGELVHHFGISKATVRRDLQILSEAGFVVISRGGVSSQPLQQNAELLYIQKRQIESKEKSCIGRAAVDLITPNSAVIIDAGTTTRAMIPFLRDVQNVKLVTNDVLIAADCSNYRGLEVTVTGGQLRRNYYTLLGYAAEEAIHHLRADIAFIGFDAIDPAKGCYITNTDEVALKRAILQSAVKIVAVCDHSKFYINSFIHVCDLSMIDVIVTGSKLDQGIRAKLEKKGIELVIVDAEKVNANGSYSI